MSKMRYLLLNALEMDRIGKHMKQQVYISLRSSVMWRSLCPRFRLACVTATALLPLPRAFQAPRMHTPCCFCWGSSFWSSASLPVSVRRPPRRSRHAYKMLPLRGLFHKMPLLRGLFLLDFGFWNAHNMLLLLGPFSSNSGRL